MSNFVGRDLTVIVYLERAETTASATRKSTSLSTPPGDDMAYSVTYQESISFKGCFATVSTLGVAPSEVHGKIVMTLDAYYGSALRTSVSKSVPYSGVVGFSMSELADAISSAGGPINGATLTLRNDTDKTLRFSYCVMRPMLVLKAQSGLVGFNCGDRLGSNDKYPDFGVCNAYGSVDVRDSRRVIASIMDDPSSYGLDADLNGLNMRVEAFLGDTLLCVMETDDVDYSDNGRDISIALKSPLLRLSEYQSYGKLVVTRNQTMPNHVYSFLQFSQSQIGLPLGAFDFSSIPNSSTMFQGTNAVVGAGVLDGPVSVSSFLDYAGQATACNVVAYDSISTSMKYKVRTVAWFPYIYSSVAVQGLRNMPDITPTDLLDTPVFDAVRKNAIDKVTYQPYRVSLSEESEETETVFRITEQGNSDEAEYKSFWLDKSGLGDIPSDDVEFGCRYPRPKDLTYDSGTGKYGVHKDGFENRQMRALTRVFLWKFPFVADHSDLNSLSGFKPSWDTVMDNVYSAARFKSLSAGTSPYLFNTGGSDSSGTATLFAIMVNGGATAQAVRATGYVKRTVYKFSQFDNLNSYFDFYANLANGRFIDSDSVVRLQLFASYWYSSVWGGAAALAYLNGNTPNYADSMRVTSGGLADYKTWAQSKASKMSEYITLEYTAEQGYAYQDGGSYSKPNACKFMMWSPFNASNGYGALASNEERYVGTAQRYDGDYAVDFSGAVVDYGGVTGVGISEDDDDGQSFWNPVQSWFHTGDDESAHGGYVSIKYQHSIGTASAAVTQDPMGGKAIAKFSLPTVADIKSAIVGGEDNFIGQTDDPSGDHPGRWRADDASPLCCFWNPAYAYSLLGNGRDGVINLDDANKGALTWITGRPMYGYVLKSIKAVISARYYAVNTSDRETVQFNRGNRCNYDMATNPLMNQLTSLYGSYCVDWMLGQLSSKFQRGRRTMSLKTKAIYALSSLYMRVPRIGDVVSGSDVLAMRDGSQTPIVPSAESWFLRGMEVVYEGGQLYYNLELMEGWQV